MRSKDSRRYRLCRRPCLQNGRRSNEFRVSSLAGGGRTHNGERDPIALSRLQCTGASWLGLILPIATTIGIMQAQKTQKMAIMSI